MVDQMNANLNGPKLFVWWILPSFSTTTLHDTIVGSIVMMSSMKKYFTYKFCILCGIPEITLLGTVKTGKTFELVERMMEWAELLGRVLDQFVLAVKGTEDIDFWQRICHNIGGGSEPSYIGGWISLFTVFNENGQWQGINLFKEYRGTEYEFPIVMTDDITPGYM
ncbi:hypothetical protein THRCLA_10298 [Thraustotheca clavata]|uniref:Uncharacterized protein n=1 Tax=Thraustotheca clavata TaxID=74557 RepID=A0A1V9YRR0_9STRA|nr:hypothetical protein THRCLA_10298 [Thraustotheca clavata]